MTPADEVRALELSLLNESVRKDAARVFSKAEVIAELQEERERRIAMQDFNSLMIDSSTMLVRYRSVRTGEDGRTIEALRSSLWVLRQGRWQILFHQGTRIEAA
jgi:hypothetical protein